MLISSPTIPEVVFERIKSDVSDFAFNFFQDGQTFDVVAKTYKFRLKASGVQVLEKIPASNAAGRVLFVLSSADKAPLTGSEYSLSLIEVLAGGGERTIVTGTLRWSVPAGKNIGLVTAPDVSVNYIAATGSLMVALGVVDFGSSSSALSAAAAANYAEEGKGYLENTFLIASTVTSDKADIQQFSELAENSAESSLINANIAINKALEAEQYALLVENMATTARIFQDSLNLLTNTPNLSGLNLGSTDAGKFWKVSDVASGGSVTSITGTPVLANVGDEFTWNGIKWVWNKASDIAFLKILDLLAKINENFEFDGGFIVKDNSGNVGLELTQSGLLRAFSIFASSLNASKINGVEFSENENYAQVLLDELGYKGYSLGYDGKITNSEIETKKVKLGGTCIESDGDGGFKITNISTNSILFSVNKFGEISDLKINAESSEPYPFSVVDSNGNISEAIDRNGKLIGFPKGSDSKSSNAGFLADIVHILFYGQSLSFGGGTLSPISLVQLYNSLSFSAGPITWLNQNAAPADVYAALKPLVEIVAESPCSGAAESIIQLIKNENFLSPLDHDFRLLLSAPGSGGKTITQLSKGSTHYAHVLSDVSYGLLRANQLGKTYNIPAIIWMQGEADFALADYATPLLQLHKDLNADIKSITKQVNDVKLFIYQTANFNASQVFTANPSLAFQQLDIVLNSNNRNIYMSGPMYQFEYQPSYDLHLLNTSSKLVGAMHGIAWKRIVVDGEDWKPIHVTKTIVQGNIAELIFHVPVKPLVLDDVLVTNPGNYGFRLFQPGGSEIPITNVSIARPDAVRIIASATIPAGSWITYGQNGVFPGSGPTNGTRGCLRDSQDIVFNPEGLNKRMYNWTPLFKKIIN